MSNSQEPHHSAYKVKYKSLDFHLRPLMVLFEKFFGQLGFDFNDFSITQRRKILKFNEKTEETEMAIQLILNIEYEEEDDFLPNH